MRAAKRRIHGAALAALLLLATSWPAAAKAGLAAGAAGSGSPLLGAVDIGLGAGQDLDVSAVAGVELALEAPRSWTYLADLERFSEDAKWRLEVDVQGLAGRCLEPPVGLKTRVRGYQLFRGGNKAVKNSLIPYAARDCEPSRTAGPVRGLPTTTDPLGYVDGPNLYQFALNNPVNFSDPMGLFTLGPCGTKVGEAWHECMAERRVQDEKVHRAVMDTLANPYVQGSIQVVGGCAEAAVGGAAVLSGAGALPGAVALAHGADMCGTGFITLAGGETQDTLFFQGVTGVLEYAGVDPRYSGLIASGVDLGVGVGATSRLSRLAAAADDAPSISRFQALRDALSDNSGRLVSRVEREGIKASIRAIEEQGYRIGGAIKFRGNQGVDLFFHGPGSNVGRVAFAEAKASSGLGSLAVDSLGICQGSYEFFRTRVARGIAWGDPARKAQYRHLYSALRGGQADLFGYFAGSDRLFRFDPMLFNRNVNFRLVPGAAISVR